jgi:hypothetical protein
MNAAALYKQLSSLEIISKLSVSQVNQVHVAVTSLSNQSGIKGQYFHG